MPDRTERRWDVEKWEHFDPSARTYYAAIGKGWAVADYGDRPHEQHRGERREEEHPQRTERDRMDRDD